jgi:hypothetical protein
MYCTRRPSHSREHKGPPSTTGTRARPASTREEAPQRCPLTAAGPRHRTSHLPPEESESRSTALSCWTMLRYVLLSLESPAPLPPLPPRLKRLTSTLGLLALDCLASAAIRSLSALAGSTALARTGARADGGALSAFLRRTHTHTPREGCYSVRWERSRDLNQSECMLTSSRRRPGRLGSCCGRQGSGWGLPPWHRSATSQTDGTALAGYTGATVDEASLCGDCAGGRTLTHSPFPENSHHSWRPPRPLRLDSRACSPASLPLGPGVARSKPPDESSSMTG